MSVSAINEVFKCYNVVDDVKLMINEQLLDLETEYIKFLNEEVEDMYLEEQISTLYIQRFKDYIINEFIKINDDKLFIKDTDFNKDNDFIISSTDKYDDIIIKYYIMYAEQLLYYDVKNVKDEYFKRYNEYPEVEEEEGEEEEDEDEEEEEEDEYDVDHPISLKMRGLIIEYEIKKYINKN